MTSERRFGLSPDVKAADQLQKSWKESPLVVLPTPYAAALMTAEQAGIKDEATIRFIVFGDHGGVKAPGPQNAVAVAMEDELADSAAAFVLSTGDIVYFNGDPSEYSPQFWEPYAHLPIPFIAVPGNHDGDASDGVAGSGIASFMANWCTASPEAPAGDAELEFGRHTQTQPSHDWALQLEAVTIIGLWSNVPSGGHLYADQVAFLEAQLKAAPTDKPLLLVVHHPPFSVDAMHGGCAELGALIDSAAVSAGSPWPTMVLSGHVHDMQVFSRAQTGAVFGGAAKSTYVVTGNGGYHNLHQLASDATPGEEVGGGVTFEYGDAAHYGFCVFTAGPSGLTFTYTQVTPGAMPDGSDAVVTPDAYAFS
jgi:hypothetical protein